MRLNSINLAGCFSSQNQADVAKLLHFFLYLFRVEPSLCLFYRLCIFSNFELMDGDVFFPWHLCIAECKHIQELLERLGILHHFFRSKQGGHWWISGVVHRPCQNGSAWLRLSALGLTKSSLINRYEVTYSFRLSFRLIRYRLLIAYIKGSPSPRYA